MKEDGTIATFQLLPALSEDEYEALKEDIAARGLLVPIEFDDTGAVLDGHHRLRACQELGIKDYPSIVRRFASEEEKIEHVLALNLARRHLTRDELRELARRLRAAAWTEERIAKALGVPQPTVHRWTADVAIIHLNNKPRDQQRAGYRKKPRPVPAVIVRSPQERERAAEALRALGDDAPGRLLDVKRAERIAREAAAAERRQQQIESVTQHGEIEIRLGDFREVLSDLEGRVDAIITDPPYPREYLPLYSDLSALAAKLLKPSGVLVAMTGILDLPEVIARLSERLRYRWTCAYVAQGPRTRVHAVRIAQGWKPLLVFVREDATDLAWLNDDVFDAATRSDDGVKKEHHRWQQSFAGFTQIVERFTAPGLLVVDPFLGSGTTAVACKMLSRGFVGCDVDSAAVATALERLNGLE